MMIENEKVRSIIYGWYEKSQGVVQQPRPDDVFDQFISLWIAFNAYYAAGNLRASEHDQLEWFKNTHKPLFFSIVEAQADEFKLLKNYIETKDCNKGFVQDLRHEVDKEEHKKRYQNLASLCEYLECIYQIRCNLFHGGKNPMDAQDEKLVKFAHATLSIFLKEILKQEGIIRNT